MKSTSVSVIVNTAAGSCAGDDIPQHLVAAFATHGVAAHLLPVAPGVRIDTLVRRALESHPKCLVAGGGDGTLNAVAAHLAGTDIALGILPLGTLNHFAKDMHIPLDLEGAVANIVSGVTTAVDLGKVNDRYFLNNSSIGLYPRLVLMRDQQQERLGRGKWSALAWAALTVLRRYPLASVRLEANGERVACRTPLVFVGNNEYTMAGLEIGQRARLDAGILSLYMPESLGRWALLKLGVRALLGRLPKDPDLDVLTAQELVIELRRAQIHVSIDGEVERMTTPLRYASCPGALRVIVPARPAAGSP